MSVLLHLIGTFFMFLGFFGVLAGILLHRMKQQDLGRMYMSTTMMGGGEMPEGFMLRLLAEMREDDGKRKQWANGILVAGSLLALLGAALS